MAAPDRRDELLMAAIESGRLDEQAAADPEVASTFAAHQKLESLFQLLRQPLDHLEDIDDCLQQPAQIGRYHVCRILGRGTFGTVYLAKDPQLGRHIAIKIPRAERFSSRMDSERFVSEARIAAQLRHPGLVSVYNIEQQGDELWIVSEYVEGGSLQDKVEQGPRPATEAAKLMAEVAEALHYAHKKGVIHRDLKPDNILIDRQGRTRVADFGLAVSEDTQRILAGQIAGTPAYMSPEQVRGETHRLDGRADIWSLGVIFYQLLTSRQPFWKGDISQCSDEILHREPKPPRQVTDAVPPELERICLKALTKDIGQRYTTAKDMAADLRSAVCPTFDKRRRFVFAVAFGMILLVATVIGLMRGAGTDSQQAESLLPENRSGQLSAQADASDTVAHLAVLEFRNNSKKPEVAFLRRGLQEMLATDLLQARGVGVVERARLEDVLGEQQLAKDHGLDPNTIARIGKGVGAKHVLVGSFTVSGNEIRIDARLVSVETHAITLAEKVTGNKNNVLELETALAEKIADALGASFSDETTVALRKRRADFETFRLYSQALTARDTGDASEAEKRLRLALARDESFILAEQELKSLESETLATLSQLEGQKLATAGQVVEALQRHRRRHQAVVEQRQFDAQYFAALVVLSAHAGIAGDPDKEWRLLARYWDEFAQKTSVSKAMETFNQVNRQVGQEGRFFQEQLDTGDYSTQVTRNKVLKPSLKGSIHQPRYAAIWPFDESLRIAFGVASGAVFPGRKIPPEHFEKFLPHYPHEYLKHVLDPLEGPAQRGSPASADYVAVTRLRMSIVRYYAGLETQPEDLVKDLRWKVVAPLMTTFKKHGAGEWDKELRGKAIAVLRLLARTSEDTRLKEQASRVLLQFVRQEEPQPRKRTPRQMDDWTPPKPPKPPTFPSPVPASKLFR